MRLMGMFVFRFVTSMGNFPQPIAGYGKSASFGKYKFFVWSLYGVPE
jgi:hypothetical protein